jgi:6-phosphogluconolactonase
VELEVVADERAAARRGAELIAEAGRGAVAERGFYALAMSGGRTPWAMLAELGPLEEMPWGETELFQVDERVAAPGSEDRNLTHLVLGLALEHQSALRPMPVTNRDLEAGAREYESSLPERLDLVHLGLGPDGHTASLFPHTEAINDMTHIVVANHVPQKDTWRITLTWPVINQGREVAFLIEGAAKAQVLHEVLQGPYQPDTYPSQIIRPASGKLTLLLDAAAAAKLPEPVNGTGTLELK